MCSPHTTEQTIASQLDHLLVMGLVGIAIQPEI